MSNLDPGLVSLAEVVRLPRNPKSHDLGALHTSYGRWGFLERVIINRTTGRMIAGHGRVDALQQCKVSGQPAPDRVQIQDGQWLIPVDYVELPEDEEEAAAIALNRLGELGGWDDSTLAQVLADLAAQEKLSGTGYDEDDLDELLRTLGVAEPPADSEPQMDRAAELQEKWQVETGQIWKMGEHLVICGDCREVGTWTQLLQAANVEKANGVFTSPPYAEQRKEQYGGVPVDEYVGWWEAVQANVKEHLAADGSFFVNIKPHCDDGQRVLYVFDLVLAMVRRWGWRFVDELCWLTKSAPGEWPNHFKNWFEPVYHFSPIIQCKFRPGQVVQEFKLDPSKLEEYGGTNSKWKSQAGSSFSGHGMKSKKFNGALPSNVLDMPSRDTESATTHAAAFPVALLTFFVKAYSDPNDVWCDPFCGSGTTILAAANNKRVGLGIEILPKYVAVILERMAVAFPDLEIEKIE